VATVMEELARYEPDLFIVYSVHNEFLERRTYEGMFDRSSIARDIDAALQKTRTWSLVRQSLLGSDNDSKSSIELLPAEVDEMLNHSIGPLDYHADDDWHDKVLRHYEMNLERMVSIAHDAGAAIVFVTPASNLRDCSPFKSETSLDLSDDQTSKVIKLVDQAKQNLVDDQFDAALTSCREALTIDPDYAEARYQSGRALFGLGRYDEAEDAFKQAIDDDICPLRANSRVSEAIRRVSEKRQVPLVDFQNLMREKCQTELGHACIGGEYFLDHVHPTIEIHRQLALWILAELQSQSFVGGTAPSAPEIDLIRRGIQQQLDIDAQGIALRNLAKVLHWAGKFSEAAPRARDAIALIPTDLESHFILADCLFNMNRVDESFAQYELLMSIGDFPRAYLPYGEMLADRDRLEEAKAYLFQAVFACRDSNRPRALYALGSVHFMLGEFALAVESLEETDRLYPADPGTLTLLAEAYISNGDVAEGIETLEQVIELDPKDDGAHYRLGMLLLGDSRFADARRHFETAIKIDPGNDRAIQALETMGQLE
jgi:tetratricopeptide (TPR) repeat protein